MNLAWYKAHCFEEFRAAVEEFNQWAELHGIEPYYDYDLAPKPSGELIHTHCSIPEVTKDNLEEISREYEVTPIYVVSAREPTTWIVGPKKSIPASGCLILK